MECRLHFAPRDGDAVELIEDTCRRCVPLIETTWGLTAPKLCHVYIVNSWWPFMFRTSSWPNKVALALYFPFWVLEYPLRRFGSLHSWTDNYGTAEYRRRYAAIGVRSLRRLAQVQPFETEICGDCGVGPAESANSADPNSQCVCPLFGRDARDLMAETVVHELTHICSGPLSLPSWLNEGLAFLTEECFFARTLQPPCSLDYLRDQRKQRPSVGYQKLYDLKVDEFSYQIARAYWMTRYLVQHHGDALRALLTRRRRHRALETEVARWLGMNRKQFWRNIDAIVVNRYAEEIGLLP